MSYKEDQDIRNDHIQSRGIIIKGNDVLVMFRRKNGKEYYVFPGGHMQNEEEPIDTAVREIMEETTIEVRNLKLAFEFINYLKHEKREYLFVGEWKEGEPKLSGEESRRGDKNDYYEPKWIPLEEIGNINLLPLVTKEWVMLYLKRFLEKK
jgi:8-oxo-dGTP diphosphatase